MKAWIRGLVSGLAFCLGSVGAQTASPDLGTLDYKLKPRQIAAGTWVIEGAVDDFSRKNGCNIINTGFIATGDGVVVINTGPSRLYGEQQRRAIEKITSEPVVQVLNLNLHPDYFFGNQAWVDKPIQALAGSIAGMQAEGRAYADNLYRLCGDWMKGTESMPATQAVQAQKVTVGKHTLELRKLTGHTRDDLVLIDHSTGVVFAGGLVFAERVPTTPHADIETWLASLAQLKVVFANLPMTAVVPSHGPVHTDGKGIAQTADWLHWLGDVLKKSADRGLDLSEVLRTPIPAAFQSWAAQPAELHRTIAQWYPTYEKQALGAAVTPRHSAN